MMQPYKKKSSPKAAPRKLYILCFMDIVLIS